MVHKPAIYIFSFKLRWVLLKKKNYFYVYYYSNNYILLFRVNKKYIINIPQNNFFLKLTFPTEFRFFFLQNKYELLFNNLIKQFCIYSIKKIKFLGKGYKIKKISTNSFLFVFNRAHLTILFFKNNFFKKIKKRKIYIRYVGFYLTNNLWQFLSAIRYVNTYTKRGLRVSRQLIYKRRGKRT